MNNILKLNFNHNRIIEFLMIKIKIHFQLAEFQKRHFNEIHPSYVSIIHLFAFVAMNLFIFCAISSVFRFERLENGKYPSLDEIKHMEEEGFNFWNYEFTIINPELYGYETIE